MGQAEDRLEIMDVLARYGHALDHDPALWDDVFTPDAVLDYPVRDADRQVRNDERQVKSAAEMGRQLAASHSGAVSQHLVGNILIDLDGDTATARSEMRMLACLPLPASGNTEISDRIVSCVDSLVRTPHGWRVTRRHLVVRYHDTRVQALYRG